MEAWRLGIAVAFMLFPAIYCGLAIAGFHDKYNGDEPDAPQAASRLTRYIMLAGAIMGLGFVILVVGVVPTTETIGYYACSPVGGALLMLVAFSGTYGRKR